MQAEADLILIDDASNPSFRRLAQALPGIGCLPTEQPSLTALTNRPRCVILQQRSAAARTSWLHELIRLKWPFACAWLSPATRAEEEEEDDGWLPLLGAATQKRRLPACILGAWRVFPALATIKELVSGGSLGAVQALSWFWPEHYRPSRRELWLAGDIQRWLAGSALVERVLTAEEEPPLAAAEIGCRIEGDAGWASARIRLTDGAGRLESQLGQRRRQRDFAGVDSLEIELGLVQRYAGNDLKAWPLLCMLNRAELVRGPARNAPCREKGC